MNLSDPTRAITPTLDGPILAVLANAGRPLTVGDIAAQAARGSEIGIRRTVARLVDQGIVRATIVGRNRVHELNREHIAAGVAELMAGLRLELWRRLRAELTSWDPTPVYAAVFGSAARGDGDETSDVDLLLVRAPFRGDRKVPPLLRHVVSAIDPETWHAQVDRLRDQVQQWTGNPPQVVELSVFEWWKPADPHRRLLAEVRRDGITLLEDTRVPAPGVVQVNDG